MMDSTDKVKTIIEELGLEKLPEKEKDNLVLKFAETLQNRIFSAIMDILTDEEKDEFNRMADKASDEEVSKFLNEKVPELDDISQLEYEKFRQELIETNQEVSNLLKSK